MNVIIIGGKAGCKLAYEIFRLRGDYILGVMENYLSEQTRKRMGIPILDRREVESEIDSGADYFVATGDNYMRKEHIEDLYNEYGKFPVNAIHPDVSISPSCRIGYGNLIMPGARINVDTEIFNGTIINTNSVIEHDCLIHDYAQISPGAILGGYVTVQELASINMGAKIAPHMVIGEGSIVAMGSAVLEDVEEYTMVAGIPAVFKKRLSI